MRARILHALLILLPIVAIAPVAQAAQPLQPWLDMAPAGGVLRLAPGTYAGPAVISKPLTLEGDGKVVIDGGGRGTVLTIRADDVTLRGLHLRGSGGSHDALDGGIMAEGNRLRIENNVIDDVLFGISLHKSNDSVVRANRIRSLPGDVADRGDGLRLWYSTGNRIEDNDLAQMRDITVTNAPHNRFTGNTIRNSRRAFNFLFAHRSLVEDNHLEKNSTGVIALNSEGMIIRRNRILHAMEASGAGVALKETSAALVQGNEIVHCAHGIMADSPINSLNRIVFIGNVIAHNVTGIYFYGVKGGHIAIDNTFRSNLWPVTIIGDGDPMNDIWWGNNWDTYEGFDLDGDGFGDRPHELYAYADRIWMETPAATFFRNSPVLELLDFLERLAPFSSPPLILRDTAPRMRGR
ncbi:MAG TPA: nitrous oxide reductase family maturation protein NosD [Rhodocyclaceae bacterium]|nr:nitrous oxide reductase family maturation protein NosD [Rhodocyclaceae bacterium]HMZ83403.1 nitrous oxide reductase family maturation protein NosD [Rhodocyclaceae bacterium]HNA03507.1 nitrous oxide reductase family maturation protein NosD [Rhodocyclaceae bacterium]HNB78573.1 nitrous oxide reductase family maturation protein NosD [Rhodocyclaceae bacterium]HNC61260.1 nitrous oxide reductase family maturation protein NosD [Rhodocyclaceae bacterium]